MPNVSAILKNHSALQVTKPARKKAPKISDQGKTVQVDNVVAYAIAEEVNLEALETHLINQGLYTIGEMPQDVTNAVLVRGKYNVDQKAKEIFVFRDGSVVFWCVPEIERGAFMKMLSKYAHAPYLTSLVIYEREELDIKFRNGKSGLVGETIHLRQSPERSGQERKSKTGHITDEESDTISIREREDDYHRLLEMYTFSNALSQSVKLAIWEASLSKFVTSIVSVTEDLRHGNKIRMSRKQVLMKTGELFSLRHLINLSSDLLDTPDFYWDRAVLEPLYQSLCNHLNIARRTRVMNEKLSHCCELTELLSTQLNDAHHTRLEVMIIVLILVEVVFECIHYVERYWESQVSKRSASSSSEV
ncbi:required for meiotic nuclear division protein 1-like protein [Plakobranchus ocellatus]|uniref:Required for meiotic nuclear division protein 1-like protein n=2 Tax=Plakobranchus ocellatus TaxID=259542 RepID=A0AAV4AVY9_9GAST|nr:required for meiotic nuclear division protein 1-like protein [Plakobranchus ocellatus]